MRYLAEVCVPSLGDGVEVWLVGDFELDLSLQPDQFVRWAGRLISLIG